MTRKNPDSARIAELVQKQKQLDARNDALQQRIGAERRQVENRATWLLGRLLKDRLTEDAEVRAWVQAELRKRLTERDWSRGVWETLFPESDGAAQ